MPITQSRVIAIILAGQDHAQALAKLIDLITRERGLVKQGAQSAEDALQNIWTQALPAALLRDEAASRATLLIEHEHFRRNAARNRASAKWAAKKRRADGVPPASPVKNRAAKLVSIAAEARTPDFPASPAPSRRSTGLSPDDCARIEAEAAAAIQGQDSAEADLLGLIEEASSGEAEGLPPGSYQGQD